MKGKINIKLVFILIIFISGFKASAQSNYFSFELAGSGGFGSINFENNILDKENLHLQMRYGFSFTPIDKNNGVNLVFPVMLHALVGKDNHKLDLAIGQALSVTTKLKLFLSAPLAIGYRYQPVNKKYYIRFSYTPLVSYLIDLQWQHWGGVTFGYQFKGKR